MIVRFAKSGKSFKGVAAYLTHDVGRAKTSERVAWTHTLNLAHDHIPSAVHEMLTTTLDAELLKAEAGIRKGSQVEKPVIHVSLNWHPSEQPDKEAMIKAAEGFLKHTDWQDHQTVLVAHQDRAHKHVHLVINAIHPETGRKLDDGFAQRRAQQWAKGYELERGHVFCEERFKASGDRQKAEPRPAWTAMREQVEKELAGESKRHAFDPSYLAGREHRKELDAHEWDILKDVQRKERLAFVAEGKQLYKDIHRAVYQEVREEFCGAWGEYYAAKRAGLDFGTQAQIRASLIERQKQEISARYEPIAAKLRSERDQSYRELLDAQKDQRVDLANRQEMGLRTPGLLQEAYGPARDRTTVATPLLQADALQRFGIQRGLQADSISPLREGIEPKPAAQRRDHALAARGDTPPLPTRRSRGPSRDVATGLVGGLLALIGGLSESLVGGHSAPTRKAEKAEALDRFDIQRGRPPPDEGREKSKRAAIEREAWYAWHEKRALDRSRSG